MVAQRSASAGVSTWAAATHCTVPLDAALRKATIRVPPFSWTPTHCPAATGNGRSDHKVRHEAWWLAGVGAECSGLTQTKAREVCFNIITPMRHPPADADAPPVVAKRR